MKTIPIGGKTVGDGHSCYVIAEAGCNHNGDLALAKKLVDMAAEAEADAVKFQSYHAENIYSRKTPMMEHFRERMDAGDKATMFDLIKATEFPWEMHGPVAARAQERGIPFLSTPFELEAVDLLETFDVPAYKIAAFEMTHYPLLERVGETGKPVILSTGMSTLGDVERALDALRRGGTEDVVLLHCVSNYPAEPEDANLRVIATLKGAFGLPVGLSDHTPGTFVSEVAFAVGANMVEKHITPDQSLPGPDHYFSLTAEELKKLVRRRDEVETILGKPYKRCTEAELEMKRIGRRSMVAGRDIAAGELLRREDIEVKRPGLGLHPMLLDDIAGSVAQRDIEADEPLSWDMLLTRTKGKGH
jgi:sialic acid synthase SpsE